MGKSAEAQLVIKETLIANHESVAYVTECDKLCRERTYVWHFAFGIALTFRANCRAHEGPTIWR